ncbi:MAG: alpha/beta hydrolase [candidate division Zixibacteria bacterium]|nr:alpha/beta hydrolase [candidate division Zixibacteria bacterium]
MSNIVMSNEDKIFYKSKDGTKLCGIFLIPKVIKGYVLLAHGINVDKNEWEDFFVDFAQELFKKGYASFRFDFRGHGESGGSQREMTIEGETLDIAASIEQISARWNGNTSIVGMSFAAGPSIIYSTKEKPKINCIVLLCPVLDYVSTFLKPTVPWGKESFNKRGFEDLDKKGFLLLDGEFQLGAKIIEEFKVIKPYELLKDIDLPVLVIHGNKDSMVPFKLAKKYGKPNKQSEFVAIKNADHGFTDITDETGKSGKSIQNRKKVIEEGVAWIEKWSKL